MRTNVKKPIALLLSALMLFSVFSTGLASVFAQAGVTADGGLPTLTFYVPETIYLKASDNKTFQYFINREQTDAGALRTSQDTTGMIYFKCADATAVTNLTCGGASVNLSTTTPSDTTLKATVNSGALSSALALNGTALVPWTVTFTLGGKSRTATAYSVAYAPNRNVTASGIYGSAYNESNSNEKRSYSSGLIFIQGAQVTSAATYNNQVGTDYRDISYQNTDSNGKTLDPLANGIGTPTNNRPAAFYSGSSPFTGATKSLTSCNCIIEISEGKYANNNQWILHTDYNATSAEITVDKSRYSNTSQVPNLKLGYMVTDYDYTNERKNWYVSDATSAVSWSGSTPRIMTSANNGYGTAYNLLAHDYYQKDEMAYEAYDRNYGTLLRHSGGLTAPSLGGASESGGCGLKYQEPIAYALSSLESGGTTTRFFRGVCSGKNGSAYSVGACAVSLKITAVDKGSLRSLVNTCIGSYLQQHYTSSTWSAYKTALENAARVLGNPMASASDISSAVSSLTTAKDELVRDSGTATVYHKSASGTTFDTETVGYDYGQTVTVTEKSYTGYNYTGSSPASLVEGDLSSATATWNLTYTPIDYALSYELNGGDAENPASYNIETPDFTLARPTKTAYTFLGWTGTDVDDPTLDVTVAQGSVGARSFEANWEPTAYTLMLDAQGGEPAGNVEYTIESDAVIPEPTRAGYDFAGWTVTAAEGTWTVGDTPAPGAPLADNWGDATLTAAWTVRHDTSYTVNHYYMNADGTYPDSPQSQVFTGTTENVVTAAAAASVPAHYSLDTENSDEEIAILGGGDAALDLYYKLDQYTVTFNVDGTETSANYYYGAVPAYGGETPTLAATDEFTYTFLGWTEGAAAEPGSGAAYYAAGNLPPVAADAVYYPYFGAAVNSYDITFSVNGTETTVSFPYGATPVFDGVPEKASDAQYTYTFAGWDPAIVPVAGEAAYTAVFDAVVRQYPVFVNGGVGSSVSLASGMYDYGAALDFTVTVNEEYSDSEPTVTVGGTALTGEKNGSVYTYSATVTGDTEIIVSDLAKNTYTVKFVVDGVETETTVAYGDTPAYSGVPAKAADDENYYVFAGWEPAVVPATADAIYTAQFDTVPFPAHEHDFATFVRTAAATCVSGGYDEYICECGMTERRNATAVNAANHALSAITVGAREATETEDGYTGDLVCPACGETITRGSVLPKTGGDTPAPHEHEFAFVRTVAATCAEKGYDEYACACGMTERRNETATVDADNHTGAMLTVGAREATETADGYTGDRVCSACGKTLAAGSVIPKTGSGETPTPHTHTFDTFVSHHDATCCEKGYDEYRCECGMTEKRNETATVDANNHAGAIITVGKRAATETADGYTGDRVCSACGKTVSTGSVIPKTGTEPTEPTEPEEPTVYETGCPICGQNHDGNFLERLLGLIHTFLHMVRTLFRVVPKN